MKNKSNWLLSKYKLPIMASLVLASAIPAAAENTVNVCVKYASSSRIACANDNSAFTTTPAFKDLKLNGRLEYFENISVAGNYIFGSSWRDYNPGFLYMNEWENITATPTSVGDSLYSPWYTAGLDSTNNKVYQCVVYKTNWPKLIGNISCRDKTNNGAWIGLPHSKSMKRAAFANSHAWGIATDDTIWYKDNYANGINDWVQVLGGLTNIAVDHVTNTVCGINSSNNIFCADWPANKGANVSWRQLPGAAKSVAVFNGKMWIAGTDEILYYKNDTTTSGSWLAQSISGVKEVVATGTVEQVQPKPDPVDPNAPAIHACARFLAGGAACANGESAFTANPSMVELSKVVTGNRINMLNVDRNYLIGLGATTSNSKAIYEWSSVSATPTISSDSNTTGQSMVWFGSAVNGTNGNVYQCRAHESGAVSCKDKDVASNWRNLTHTTAGFKHLALANSHIWGIAKDNSIWYKENYANTANDWVQIPGGLVNIAVDYKTNTICGNNSAYNIFCADWPHNQGAKVSWRQISGAAKSVATYDGKMWVVGTDNYIYYKPDTSSKGNWTRTNVSNVADVTVSGVGNVGRDGGPYGGLTWMAQGDKYVSFTNSQQEVQCASEDGKTCLTNITLERAKKSTNPLVCGEMLRSISGVSGYNTSGHWCKIAAKGWIWSSNIGLYWKEATSGDPSCASNDGRNCFWWSGKNLEWVVSTATNPLACGNDHYSKYGSSGYTPGHWCKYLKDNQESTTIW